MVAGPRIHRVPPQARGQRLDAHLAATFPDLTRARVQKLIATGAVKVEGQAAKPSLRLRGGEAVAVEIPPPVQPSLSPEALPLSVLFEDAQLLVLDKAAGMVVHPGAGHWSGTVVNALLHRVGDLGGIGGELRPGIVHRLDKETSGCLVVAKNEAALLALQRAFKGRQVEKTYLAIVRGWPVASERIETLHGRHPVHRKRFTGRVKQGKVAITAVERLEQFDGAALVKADLHTGRTHQIRVHLSERGHPLLGDSLYGGRRKPEGRALEAERALGRLALHAWRLSFPHPRTGKRLSFEAPLPADFARALELLRRPAR